MCFGGWDEREGAWDIITDDIGRKSWGKKNHVPKISDIGALKGTDSITNYR